MRLVNRRQTRWAESPWQPDSAHQGLLTQTVIVEWESWLCLRLLFFSRLPIMQMKLGLKWLRLVDQQKINEWLRLQHILLFRVIKNGWFAGVLHFIFYFKSLEFGLEQSKESRCSKEGTCSTQQEKINPISKVSGLVWPLQDLTKCEIFLSYVSPPLTFWTENVLPSLYHVRHLPEMLSELA